MEMICSPFAKNIYTQIEDAGKNTFNPAFCKIRGVDKALEELKPYIAVLSEDAVITKKMFRELLAEVFSDKKEGSTLSLTEAKEKSGLSRRVLIPFLEYLDKKGYTKRRENERIFLSTKSEKETGH